MKEDCYETRIEKIGKLGGCEFFKEELVESVIENELGKFVFLSNEKIDKLPIGDRFNYRDFKFFGLKGYRIDTYYTNQQIYYLVDKFQNFWYGIYDTKEKKIMSKIELVPESKELKIFEIFSNNYLT